MKILGRPGETWGLLGLNQMYFFLIDKSGKLGKVGEILMVMRKPGETWGYFGVTPTECLQN